MEDDYPTRHMYRATLTAAGFHVVAVEDGVDALRTVDAGELPDAVVLDLGLPRLHGRDVYKELRARSETSTIPVIIVTGSDIEDRDTAEFRFFLRKPLDPNALIFAVDNALRQARRFLNSPS